MRLQDGREALRSFAEFQRITRELLEEMRDSGACCCTHPVGQLVPMMHAEGHCHPHGEAQLSIRPCRFPGGPADDDGSIGAHLLRIRDADGKPLPDERLLPHIGMFFFAGFDTTGHTMAWTL